MTNLDSIFKSRDITLPTKVRLVKAMVFPVVMYGYESWTVKKAECRRIDAFELWCWRRLLRVPWTARRSQSILKEIALGFLWKEWCWSWNSSSLATSWEVLTHWKRPLPESSSSSQGISLKWWVVLADNDVASYSRCGAICLFQASGFLLYFDKCIRSEVWQF